MNQLSLPMLQKISSQRPNPSLLCSQRRIAQLPHVEVESKNLSHLMAYIYPCPGTPLGCTSVNPPPRRSASTKVPTQHDINTNSHQRLCCLYHTQECAWEMSSCWKKVWGYEKSGMDLLSLAYIHDYNIYGYDCGTF
jgi:hypothetical protein